jgi:hypothetical protein
MEPIFALLLIAFELSIYFIIKSEKLSSCLFLFFLWNLWVDKIYFEKRKWINNRLKSNVVGKNIEIEFIMII